MSAVNSCPNVKPKLATPMPWQPSGLLQVPSMTPVTRAKSDRSSVASKQLIQICWPLVPASLAGPACDDEQAAAKSHTKTGMNLKDASLHQRQHRRSKLYPRQAGPIWLSRLLEHPLAQAPHPRRGGRGAGRLIGGCSIGSADQSCPQRAQAR
jgi:hypothetical protein